jgi:hypothetical protein
MARLGAISLFGPAPVRSPTGGAAFTLTSAASADASLELPEGELEIKAGQRDVVVRFDGASSAALALQQGHRLAQQGLDLLSVLGRTDAVIQEAENEHLIWWSEPDGVVVRLVSTTLLRFAVGPVRLEVRDKSGNIIPATAPQPRHHIAFRYYRLAQTTEDLYDAYRNMYLAFEVLLSNQFPMSKGEREIDWLHRALDNARSTIRLDDLVSPGTNVIDSVLLVVYQDARLPLFHAKEGRDFFPPQGSPTDRQVVAKALAMLTQIVLRMAEGWFSVRRTGGGVFFSWVYENAKQMLSTCSMIATNYAGSFDASERDLSHERFGSAIEFDTRLAPELQRGREPAFLGTVQATKLAPLGEVRRIELITSDHPYMAQLLESPLACDDAARLEVLMHVRATNLNQPKSLFRQ